MGKTWEELITGQPQPLSEWEYLHWLGLNVVRESEKPKGKKK